MNKEGLCVIDPSVTEAYQWFLREYHRVQSAFYLTHSESSTSFSEEDFARHKEVLLNFTPEL
jgi:hypothetical protein